MRRAAMGGEEMTSTDGIAALLTRGPQRTFSGEALRTVAFPLGGIGTGTVSLGGCGELRDWEIFNRPAKGRWLPYTFFAIWARPAGGAPVARVLERRLLPPYVASGGLPPGRLGGLPRLDEARFTGEYPFARLAFDDAALPLAVELEAYTPFVPLDAEASGLPVAIFTWRLSNAGPAPVAATVALSLLNAAGYDGVAELRNRRHPLFGGNRNEFRDEGGLRGLYLAGGRAPAGHPGAGSLAVATPWPAVTATARWERAGWFDDLQRFWDDFRADGRLDDLDDGTASPDGETDVGTLGLVAEVPPGGEVRLPFVLAWHFPNLTNYWNPQPAVAGRRLGNWYTTRHADAWAAARFTIAHLPELEARTRRYHTALFGSTLPDYVLDAVSSQASIIRTTTCLRTEDGVFHAFEGCHDNAGCCPMDCTHVWNYEQALAHLFPALERTMRATDLQVNTRPSGEQAFRTLLPVTSGALWEFHPAADGQMGSLLKLYREWQLSGDDAFLRQLWPAAKRALEFAWAPHSWDADRDGVMEGEQHNTYDIEFYGPNSMMGTLYLAALRAAAAMARAVGDPAADGYAALAERGAAALAAATWNGEYFEQRVVVPPPEGRRPFDIHGPAIRPGEAEPRYQYGPGCLADQLLGQWFARVVGLGPLLPVEQVRSALAAIVRHNWRADLRDHHSCQRTYALDDEAGLLLCTWPRGGRPRYPFPYADEVWTGIEYQVAAHLIYEGLVAEGLAIVRGLRARHDGARRNPWDEFECGHHYARAMAAWSLLLALSGYEYSAPAGRLGFAPVLWPEDFRCLYTTGGAWGVYRQQRQGTAQQHHLGVSEGRLALRTLAVAVPAAAGEVAAELVEAGGRRPLAARRDGDRLYLDLAGATLAAGEELTVALHW
jgi:non-lysosomal glucosylceramidase